MIAIPEVLDAAAVAHVRSIIDDAEWVDGNVTSGHQSALVKHNEQLPEGSAAARDAGNLVLDALGKSPTFIAAALPLRVFPPLFNRYRSGQAFGAHVDNAIRIRRGSDFRIRSDLSATLFLNDPAEYDGGELTIEGHLGTQAVKLPAGQMILYPSTSLHHVSPVTRGTRIASFFWIQSMIRSEDARTILFDLDTAIQRIAMNRGQADAEIVRLTSVYHNLLRMWAET
jgi:PKHD-type hydroxylase